MEHENQVCAHCNCKNTARDQKSIKSINSRINRIIGQLSGVKNMIEDNRYCVDILIQLSAVSKAVKSLSGIVLEDHLNSCVVEKINAGDQSVIDELFDIFKKF